MYSRSTGLVFGFHGCDETVCSAIVAGKDKLRMSQNAYDWLGHGFYFWENDIERALDWAKQMAKKPKSKISKPTVLGAVIDLGFCLDFLNNRNIKLLAEAYKNLYTIHETTGSPLPENQAYNNSIDLVQRYLDCAVIESIHQTNKDLNKHEYDSVRGVFFEGQEVYPTAGFRTGNHIQICIRNTDCIKGYFLPLKKGS